MMDKGIFFMYRSLWVLVCVYNRSAAEGRATSELQAQEKLLLKIWLICAGSLGLVGYRMLLAL